MKKFKVYSKGLYKIAAIFVMLMLVCMIRTKKGLLVVYILRKKGKTRAPQNHI